MSEASEAGFHARYEALRTALPFPMGEEFLIRPLARPDLDRLAQWPAYPFPYETFRFSFATASREERDRRYDRLCQDPSRLAMVVEQMSCGLVGYIALVDIDWKTRSVGNLSVRVHPAWCDRGIGTRTLRVISEWAFDHGLARMTLDVAASNGRAIRSYEKAGFRAVGELWRSANDLANVDLSESRYDFVRPHLRFTGGMPELRFVVMQATIEG